VPALAPALALLLWAPFSHGCVVCVIATMGSPFHSSPACLPACLPMLSRTAAAAVAVSAILAYVALFRSSGLPSADMGSGEMFDGIAPMYDVANKMMSLGMDMQWRRALVEALNLRAGLRVLDLATGTADVAILAGLSQPEMEVLGIDPSEEMLNIGRGKVTSQGLDGSVRLVLGDAQDLSGLESASFDRVTMSFGIRNVPDRGAALREIRRVLKPDGIAAIMELHLPSEGWLAPVAQAFIKYAAPLVGTLSGAHREYQHLQKSISSFPSPGEWRSFMAECRLPVHTSISFCWGVVQIYVAHPAPLGEEVDS
jgi:demethylmenaquinone methyltransferase/2-methoxy-6-polyprenyl-1,4-benzoquinol methylase